MPQPSTILELAIAVTVFAAIALLAINYPKVGKPLEFLVLAALAVRAVGALKNA